MSHYFEVLCQICCIFYITQTGQYEKSHARGFTLLDKTCPNAHVIFLK